LIVWLSASTSLIDKAGIGASGAATLFNTPGVPPTPTLADQFAARSLGCDTSISSNDRPPLVSGHGSTAS
jgi:hypothetical protein